MAFNKATGLKHTIKVVQRGVDVGGLHSATVIKAIPLSIWFLDGLGHVLHAQSTN